MIFMSSSLWQTLAGSTVKMFSTKCQGEAREFFEEAMPAGKVWKRKPNPGELSTKYNNEEKGEFWFPKCPVWFWVPWGCILELSTRRRHADWQPVVFPKQLSLIASFFCAFSFCFVFRNVDNIWSTFSFCANSSTCFVLLSLCRKMLCTTSTEHRHGGG